MRVLGTADLHLGLQRYGTPGPDGLGSRIRDFEATLGRFVDVAIERRVDLAVFAGDTFATRREAPHERATFARSLTALSEAGIVSLVIDGNHDGKGTVGAAETASLRWLAELVIENVHVILEPWAGPIDTRTGSIAVVAMPYPHRQLYDAEFAALPPSERVLHAGPKTEAMIRDLLKSIEERPGPRLFIGHLTVADSVAGSETAMKMGWDVAIRRKALDAFDLSVLGHIHRFQRLGKVRAWYCGSPEYVDFTEAGLDKGFLYAEFERGVDPKVELVPSGARPMYDLPVLWDNNEATIVEREPIEWERGPMIRVLLRAARRPDPADLDRVIRTLMGRGASFVKVEPQVPERTREVIADSEPEPELDIIEATRRFLTDAGFANVEAAIEVARTLVPV